MRILQVNKFFYRRGGSETYFFELADLLKKNGHEVIHFSTKAGANLASPNDEFFIEEINFGKREGLVRDLKKFGHSLYSFEAKKKLEKLIIATKPDIAHLHNISHHISPSIFSVFKKYKIPVVQTLHDYQLICPNFKLFTEGAVCERCKKYRYWNAVFHRCVHDSRFQSLAEAKEMFFHRACQFYEKGVKCFVTPSKFLAGKLAAWQVKSKVENTPLFLDASRFLPKYEPGDYVIYFGRLAKEKGIDILFRALADTDIKLKIVGDGQESEKLKVKSEKLKVNVEFVEHKSGKELHDLIRDSKFVVLPSIWYENYPMSLLEAGALGKAAVASSLGGIPEIIYDGENGFLAAPNDVNDFREKIQRLFGDNDLCEKMGRRAREMILENNSPEDHYKKIMKVYETLTTND
ncbi:glycosyltransferase family 4 protein [Candidatus Falkowbacteria bacterium]|nr:glycosyltransferase family 4 protein [Candidatus Falkowbacteria bacterium]